MTTQLAPASSRTSLLPFDEAAALVARLDDEIGRVIIGQQQVRREILTCLFAGGHCLLRGVPGLAKTLLIKTLADAVHLKFSRIQFTPDLMPSDILGTEVIEDDAAAGKRHVRFIPGPVFANIILADEINRTPPKTQAALLEAMQEYQVTVGGVRYRAGAAAVRARDAEPDRAGRHVSAARGAARSLHVQRRDRLSRRGRRAAHPRRDDDERRSRGAARRDGRGARGGAHAGARAAGRGERRRLRAAADSRDASGRSHGAAAGARVGALGRRSRAPARRCCSAQRRAALLDGRTVPAPDDVRASRCRCCAIACS